MYCCQIFVYNHELGLRFAHYSNFLVEATESPSHVCEMIQNQIHQDFDDDDDDDSEEHVLDLDFDMRKKHKEKRKEKKTKFGMSKCLENCQNGQFSVKRKKIRQIKERPSILHFPKGCYYNELIKKAVVMG